MKIAIISDIHDNINSLVNCLKLCNTEKINTLFCLGDVANQDTLNYLSTYFNGDIFLVRGNACNYSSKFAESLKNVKYFENIAELNIDNLNIAIFHEPSKIKLFKKNLSNFDFIFYGHTHKPWIEKIDNYYFVNPGSLANDFYSPSFAILETKKKQIDLKILN